MTRVRLHQEEWYPVYEVVEASRTYAPWVEVSDALLVRALKAEKEFKAAQEALEEAYDAAYDARQPGDEGWFDTRSADAPRGLV